MNQMTKPTVSVLIFCLHQIFTPYILMILSAYLTFSAMPLVHIFGTPATAKTAHWVLTETPYFPVQITIGLLAGFLAGRLRTPFASWVWVTPFLILVAALFFRPLQPGQGRLDHFFGWGGLPPHRQYDEVVITMPFYLAAAYSAAATLSARIRHRNIRTAAVTA